MFQSVLRLYDSNTFEACDLWDAENKKGPEGPFKRDCSLPLLYKVVSLAVDWCLGSQTEVCFVCTWRFYAD